MAAERDLEQVIADWRGDAQVLRSRGHAHDAKLLEDCADQVVRSAEDYLKFLTESDAMLRSNRARDWFRSRYPEWEAAGHARKQSGVRYYRTIMVPQRANLSAAREEGKRVGMKRAS